MRLHYPMAYKTVFLMKEGKKPVSRILHELREVDVPEVGSGDAPLAAQWTDTETGRTARRVRYFDGKFYAFCGNDGKAAFASRFRTDKAGVMPPASSIAYMLGDNKADSELYCRNLAESCLLVDGALYMRIKQPVLFFEARSYGFNLSKILTTYSYVHNFNGDNLEGVSTQSLRPLTDGDAIAEMFAAHPENKNGFRYDDLVVFMPDVFDFDWRNEACGRVVGQAMMDNECYMNSWPRAAIAEYLPLRELYGQWVVDPASVDVVDLMNKTFDLFTGYPIYNQKLVQSFLASYEIAQRNLPDISFSQGVPSPSPGM